MFKRKKTLTVLELLIALAILSIILSVFFNFYRGLVKRDGKVEAAINSITEQHIFLSKLHSMFGHIHYVNEGFYSEVPLFDTHSPSVFIKWDNGAQLNPSLCGNIGGKIYGKDKAIYMQYLDTKEKVDDILLLNGVDRYELSLFDAERKIWVTNWEKDKGVVPAMIKFSFYLQQKPQEPWEVVFFLHDISHGIAHQY